MDESNLFSSVWLWVSNGQNKYGRKSVTALIREMIKHAPEVCYTCNIPPKSLQAAKNLLWVSPLVVLDGGAHHQV